MYEFSAAKWIWSKQQDYGVYNDAIIARKTFKADNFIKAEINITADSFYRLYINGKWIADGPSKYWPKHIKYDVIDITSALSVDNNEIKIVARYFGTGDFRHLPCQSGLIAEIKIFNSDGTKFNFGTDKSWEVSKYFPLQSRTPKICIQLEPFELYDARMEDKPDYRPAIELFNVENGPWKGFSKRDVPLLSKENKNFRRLISSNIILPNEEDYYCINPDILLCPGLINADANIAQPYALACAFTCTKECDFKIYEDSIRNQNLLITVDGLLSSDGIYRLSIGEHLILVMAKELTIHDKDVAFKIARENCVSFFNPLNRGSANPWCFLIFKQYGFIRNDIDWIWVYDEPKLKEIKRSYKVFQGTILNEVKDVKSFSEILGRYVKDFSSEQLFLTETYNHFKCSSICSSADEYVEYPEGLIYDNYEHTVIMPAFGYDIQLCYDLGEQVCGCCNFELFSQGGVQVDVFGVEYIDSKAGIQHTGGCRNGFSYITKNGFNKYVSLKRFSGRYIFITLRNMTKEVNIRNIAMVSSIYPLDIVGDFNCNDPKLNSIWNISVNTLSLCMDDTFVDCPVYEQTYWVGDARNEALFAMGLLRRTEVIRRGLEIASQSLDMYPLVLSHAPTSWSVIIPSFSFLWQISVYEYYFYTGDKNFLSGIYDKVIKNTKNAVMHLTDDGLFKSNYWNMCDWTSQDDVQKIVFYNSIFLCGALEAVRKMSIELGTEDTAWIQEELIRVKKGINIFWDADKGGYPDSIHSDGLISDSFSQHTSFLGLLYDVIEECNTSQAIENVISPRDALVRVGSPFSSMFLYECIEKLGYPGKLIEYIVRDYGGMVDRGATTVWETYSTSHIGQGGFPTRSHCHAFSCAPLYFLPKVVLGIKQVSTGCKAFDISPVPSGLTFANGSYATPFGAITVNWKIEGDVFMIDIANPENVTLRFVGNDSLSSYRIILNGQIL